LRAHDANLFRVDLNALRERAEMVAAVAARLGPPCVSGLVADRLGSVTRSFSIGSAKSTMPFSIAS
jgi:hypothetical protein